HHRNRRSKGQINSELREIKGIGEKTEELLLKRFGSLKAVRKATYQEIFDVAGKKVATIITAYFSERER
ncbi:MAG: excinuclease ABC subunit C, partial [Bacteroidia bacterium]|nr:excinuclease ABC subunit C [Bacteroidia bacterium]